MSQKDLIHFIKICFSLPQQHSRNEAISDVLVILQIENLWKIHVINFLAKLLAAILFFLYALLQSKSKNVITGI